MLKLIGRFLILFIIFISTIFLTCSKDSTGHQEEGTLIKAINGGVLTSPDGLLTLTIPPNALDADTYINIEIVQKDDYPDVLDSMQIVGEVYELRPDRLELNIPAKIENDMPENEVSSIITDDRYPLINGILISSDGTVEGVDSSHVQYNLMDGSAIFSGRISHFSFVFKSDDIYTYPPFKIQGKIFAGAEMGPDVSFVDVEHSVSVKFDNASPYDLFIAIKNGTSLDPAVGWTSVPTFCEVPFFGSTTQDITPQWSCEETGSGSIFLSFSVTILDPDVEAPPQGSLLSLYQEIECIAPVVATFCGDNQLRQMMGFWFKYFGNEPCEAVNKPPEDRTVINSPGVIQDIIKSMVSTYGNGILKKDITDEQKQNIEEDFEFNTDGLTISLPQNYKTISSSSQMFDTEEYVVLFNVMHEDIPIADPVNHFQYGFVFDRDGITTNNYQPSPSFPYDFYQDTDYWIEAMYDPINGWGMQVTDVANNSHTLVESNARMIIMGNTLILFVPRSEFLADTIGYRMTAYRHPGDWGLTSGDWDGDVLPPVADGLNWVNLDHL